jgi:hypothetical protein
MEPACLILGKQGKGVPGDDLQMLRGVEVGKLQGLIQRFETRSTAEYVRQGRFDNLPPGQVGQFLGMISTTAGQVRIRGHQDRGGLGVVLHLGEKVHRHEAGFGRIIRQDQGLAGSRRGVDVHLAENQQAWPQ